MGLCILFPALCGLKTQKVAEMKQITFDLCETLAYNLEKTEGMSERMLLIETSRQAAIVLLAKKGYNPYE